MQLGFVIDHSKCIGCHACTIACKSENDVPLGNFRTWVKYTETGEFPADTSQLPSVKRHFAVLRCNQCSDAPCVEICPTSALEKRTDGIVDLHQDHCIGCKSCMQACPYDALYINEDEGTAEKCHFCAHRTERGLAPACAIVCPTEAILPGDFHDPNSLVARMKATGELTARKEEAGTHPNVWYREVDPSGICPSTTTGANGYIWSNRPDGPHVATEDWEALEARAQGSDGHAPRGHGVAAPTARTTYDVPKKPLWGGLVTGYLWFKSLSAGAFLAGLPILLADGSSQLARLLVPLLGILFLVVTSGLLVGDLKRPDRFLYILKRPNWSSWLAKGSLVLMAYGGLLSVWLLLGLLDVSPDGFAQGALGLATAGAAAMTAAYTAFLFAQAKARPLWMHKHFWLHLVLQALVAGGGLWAVLAAVVPVSDGVTIALRGVLGVGLVGHAAFLLMHHKLAPTGREAEYHRAVRLMTHGPFARKHKRLGLALGCAAPLILLLTFHPIALALAGACALGGLFAEEDVFVRAGQALPIS